jgi:L-alanine-DL-glutamate epimerase-like enolase superfamily enzyme
LALQRMPDWQAEFDDGSDREAMAALSGLDMALWDLTATAHGLSLHQLLGRALPARVRADRAQQVRVYASGGLYHPVSDDADAVAALLAEMLPAVDSGHDALKIKVGGAPLEQDVRRVAALRETVGSDVHLMADANCALDPETAMRWLEAMQPFDLHWFEEPLPRDDWAGLKQLQRSQAVPLCGNEGETGNDPISRLLYHRCVDFLQIDLSICGGFTAAMRYLALAELHQVPVTLHAAASAVLHQANAHLAAACRNRPWVESHLVHRWFHEAIEAGEPQVSGGLAIAPSGPGLGLDRERLARG